MAIVNENLLVRGARGNVGKQFVYRKKGNNTLITRMPVPRKDAVATEKQVASRELFSAAALYAKGAIKSEELKNEYEKKSAPGNSAYNIAFRDFLKAPVVKKIDVSNYKGTPGSTIVINAKDDFRVAEVSVHIQTAAGVLVEEGTAILNPINRNLWTFTAVQNNAALTGSVISATAKDLPGNTGSLEITV
jgi:hypothetical protein